MIARLNGMRKMMAERGKGDTKKITPEDLSRAGIEIRKLAAAGKLSAEDGRAKMHAICHA